ncbi:MAG: hypothetical protein SFV18_20945 [Bryobacteraceae bacterium]|nr:hypothetical protein [Bryobacteraceae bacterium]
MDREKTARLLLRIQIPLIALSAVVLGAIIFALVPLIERYDETSRQVAEKQLALAKLNEEIAGREKKLAETESKLGKIDALVEERGDPGLKAAVRNLVGAKIGIYYLKEDAASAIRAERLKKDLSSFAPIVQLYPRAYKFFLDVALPEGDELRYEDPAELSLARNLQSRLAKLDPSAKYVLRPVVTPTPNFVSIFLKPNPVPVK